MMIITGDLPAEKDPALPRGALIQGDSEASTAVCKIKCAVQCSGNAVKK
jgi:hypothetical protein